MVNKLFSYSLSDSLFNVTFCIKEYIVQCATILWPLRFLTWRNLIYRRVVILIHCRLNHFKLEVELNYYDKSIIEQSSMVHAALTLVF